MIKPLQRDPKIKSDSSQRHRLSSDNRCCYIGGIYINKLLFIFLVLIIITSAVQAEKQIALREEEHQTIDYEKKQISGDSKSKEPEIYLNVWPDSGTYLLYFYNYRAHNIPDKVENASLEVYLPNQKLFWEGPIPEKSILQNLNMIQYKIPADIVKKTLGEIQPEPDPEYFIGL
jgi:hypothetical protein